MRRVIQRCWMEGASCQSIPEERAYCDQQLWVGSFQQGYEQIHNPALGHLALRRYLLGQVKQHQGADLAAHSYKPAAQRLG